jgi:aquaporin Z
MAHKNAISSHDKSTVDEKSKVETTVTATDSSMSSVASTYKSVRNWLSRTPRIVSVLVAEFIGTFLLTASFLEMQSSPLYLGFAVIGIVLIVGGASGAHLNPAITIGAMITNKIKASHAAGYIVAQVLGAGSAWAVLHGFLVNGSATASTSSLFHAATVPSGKQWYLFFIEFVGTIILTLGFAMAVRQANHKHLVAATVSGLTIMIALYITMSISTVLLTESNTTLTFLNPALAFAANGLSWNIWPIAIYIVAPVLGSIIGFALQDFMHVQSDDACDCGCSCCGECAIEAKK